MSTRFTKNERISVFLMAGFSVLFLLFQLLFPKLFQTEDTVLYELTEIAISRFLAGTIFLFLCRFMGYPLLSFHRLPNGKALLLSFPALLVAINNFPILGLLCGTVWVDRSFPMVLLLIAACFGIGFFEELAFRGVIFPMLLERLLKRLRARANPAARIAPENAAVFLSILLTSAVFGLFHLLNLFVGGSPAAVFLQIGYSFLIGGMCAIVLLKTRCIWFPVLIHAVYDVGGSLIGYLGGGSLWDTPTVILTAVLGVMAAAWFVVLLIRMKPEEIEALLSEETRSGAASD